MDNREIHSKIDKVESKLDRLDEKFDLMNITLIKQEESLRYHVKRTDLAESRMDQVEKTVEQAAGIVKFISLIGVVVGIAAGLVKIWFYLH